MPGGRKSHKKHAADHADAERKDVQNLPRLLLRRRAETLHHVLVSQRHRHEDQNRQRPVEAVDEPRPVPGQIRQGVELRRRVEDPQARRRGQAVDDAVVREPEAVGEAGEEGGGSEEEEEEESHGASGGVAGAVAGEGRDEELEGEEGAGGKEVGEVGGDG